MTSANQKKEKEKEKPYWTETHLGLAPEMALGMVFVFLLMFTIICEPLLDKLAAG